MSDHEAIGLILIGIPVLGLVFESIFQLICWLFLVGVVFVWQVVLPALIRAAKGWPRAVTACYALAWAWLQVPIAARSWGAWNLLLVLLNPLVAAIAARLVVHRRASHSLPTVVLQPAASLA